MRNQCTDLAGTVEIPSLKQTRRTSNTQTTDDKEPSCEHYQGELECRHQLRGSTHDKENGTSSRH